MRARTNYHLRPQRLELRRATRTGLPQRKIFKRTAAWDLRGPPTAIFIIDAHDNWDWRSALRARGVNDWFASLLQ
jgi:hypothetical protein